jgi:proteasome accessory factor B
VHARYNSHFERRLITVTLHPYRLVHAAHGWNLIAFCEQASRVQIFKLSSFAYCRNMPSGFRPGPKINLKDYFGNAWSMDRGDERHHVRIRFSRAVSHRVSDYVWHQTQRVTPEADGALLFEVDVDGLKEIVRWILAFGDQAQVLEPPALRRLVAGHAQRMRARYESVPVSWRGLQPSETAISASEDHSVPIPSASFHAHQSRRPLL